MEGKTEDLAKVLKKSANAITASNLVLAIISGTNLTPDGYYAKEDVFSLYDEALELLAESDKGKTSLSEAFAKAKSRRGR